MALRPAHGHHGDFLTEGEHLVGHLAVGKVHTSMTGRANSSCMPEGFTVIFSSSTCAIWPCSTWMMVSRLGQPVRPFR